MTLGTGTKLGAYSSGGRQALSPLHQHEALEIAFNREKVDWNKMDAPWSFIPFKSNILKTFSYGLWKEITYKLSHYFP